MDFSLMAIAREAPIALSVVALLTVYISYKLLTAKKLNLPIAHLEPGNVTEQLMVARSQYPDRPFILPLKPQWVILPHHMVSEIRSLPEEKISFKKHTYHRMLGQYTGIGSSDQPEAIRAIKVDLTRNVAKILSDLQDEIQYALDENVGDCPDWKPIPVYLTLLKIISLVSGRAFVGLPLSRDPEWTEATINFTKDVVAAMNSIRKVPAFLRPIVSPYLPTLRKLMSYRNFAADKMAPQVNAILSAHREKVKGIASLNDEEAESAAIKGNFNLVHWMIGQFKDPERANAMELGRQQMTAAFAAIHPIGMATSYAVFDLAAYPQYMAELRVEIEDVISEENYPDGQLRKSSVPKLKKLDSFMKESQRMSPPTMTPMNRIVTSPTGVTLSDGTYLPHQTVVGFGHPFYPSSTVPTKSPLRTPSQPPLTEFHPFRFSNLRTQKGEENNHQFVTSDPNNIAFGYGRNTCPGRFFASNEIKVILIEILKRYDIALGPNGESLSDGFERPKMLESGPFYGPDPKGVVYFRNRRV